MSRDSGRPPAVVDTNVVVSGSLTDDEDAPTRRLLDRMLAGELRYYLSVDLLAEYREVLSRPKIASLHGLSDDQVDTIVERLTLEGIFRDPRTVDLDAPDPGDQHLWDLTVTVDDAILVTGDSVLLAEPPEDVSVVTPRDYLKL